MAGRIEARLAELNIALPQAATPVANYVPYVVSGPLVFLAGQVTVWNGEIRFVGKLGREFTVEEGQEAARLCGLNLIAQARAACEGDLDRVVRCVKLTGFVNSMPDFTDQPKVMNGASDLMTEVFGESGRHARAAIGVNTLPLGVAVEVEGIFEIA
ncbi:MAG: RidA family protein [Alphaproteobacteria bacterium]